MIFEKQLPELSAYHDLEATLPIESVPGLHGLVAPGPNDELPVYRWFRFKEGFSGSLARALLWTFHRTMSGDISVLDPFCGAGTTLVAAQELSPIAKIRAVGIERNPFVHFVSSTKAKWPLMNSEQILKLGRKILAASPSRTGKIPELSSLTTGRCMSRHTAQRIVTIRDTIRASGSTADHDALLLGLASVVEQLSKTRKDGRALRLVERNRQDISRVLWNKWSQMASDVRLMQEALPQTAVPKVVLGDGRTPISHGVDPLSIHLLITSPPYPNNIDYSEVYKLELWLLGFVSDARAFLDLRKATFCSHPTAVPMNLSDNFRNELEGGHLKTILAPIIDRTKSSAEKYRQRLVLGYAADLWSSLQEHYRVLKSGGYCVIVVGNSLHGGKHLPYLIPTDLMVSAIAQRTGYKVREVAIARNFRRRLSGNHFLRESVIVLEKE